MMDPQATSLNQSFRDRIRGYMKSILIFNSLKLLAALGALVSAIFIKVNVPVPSAVYFALPITGGSVTIIVSIAVVVVFSSDDRKEHFINNVILYRIVVAVAQIPLAVGFGTSMYLTITYSSSNFSLVASPRILLPLIMYLVFSGLVIFVFGIGSAVCMRRIYFIKFYMFLANTTRAGAAPASYPPGYSYTAPAPKV